jgi:adenylate cyclase
VIGAAANEAARLAGMCRELGRSVLVSSAFPTCFPDEMVSLGHHTMRGVETPQEIFTLIDHDD